MSYSSLRIGTKHIGIYLLGSGFSPRSRYISDTPWCRTGSPAPLTPGRNGSFLHMPDSIRSRTCHSSLCENTLSIMRGLLLGFRKPDWRQKQGCAVFRFLIHFSKTKKENKLINARRETTFLFIYFALKDNSTKLNVKRPHDISGSICV